MPNIYVKMSGFHYVAPITWEYPYHDTHDVVRKLYEAFGAHCSFIAEADRQKILGPSLQRLFAAST